MKHGRKKEEKLWLVKLCRQLIRFESYMTVQHANLAISFNQEIIASRHGLLSRRFVRFQVLCGKLQNVIVIDVHSFRRLFLVLARSVVVALIVIQLVGFRARTLACACHILRTLRWSQDACASDDDQRTRTRVKQ